MGKVLAPFKHIGGKGAVVDQILPHVPLDIRVYHEPFFGSGALFFAWRQENALTEAVVSDADLGLVNTWYAVMNVPKKFAANLERLKGLYETQDPEDLYYRVRDAWNAGYTSPERFVFLRQTAFNGLWRCNKSGYLNMAWGKFKNPSIVQEDKILACHKALKRVGICYRDWRRSFEEILTGDFAYVDPPYLGTFSGYQAEGFTEQDHIELLQACAEKSEKGVRILYSNTKNEKMDELIDTYWPHVKRHVIHAPRSVNSDGEGRAAIAEYLLEGIPWASNSTKSY